MNSRFVIPANVRVVILKSLHSAHQGCTSMLARARTCVYWPSIDKQINQFKSNCHSCSVNAPSQSKEPLNPSEPPDWPFQRVAADYCEINSHAYLVIADAYSGWINIFHFPISATSQKLIAHVRKLFEDYGTAETFQSDGGPQFMASNFQKFLKQWNCSHRLSSVAYPQSNGRAEVAVKTAKRILRENITSTGSLDTDKVARAILQYRNTPLPHVNLSPAQILFHRELRDFLPVPSDRYKLHEDWLVQAQHKEFSQVERNNRIAQRYNQTTTLLQPLPLGCSVLIQNRGNYRRNKWDRSGTIVQSHPHRQYSIRLHGSGRVTLQNRRFLKMIPPKTLTSTHFPITSIPGPVLEHPTREQGSHQGIQGNPATPMTRTSRQQTSAVSETPAQPVTEELNSRTPAHHPDPTLPTTSTSRAL